MCTYTKLSVAFVIDGALARDARSLICTISCAFEFKLGKSGYSTTARWAAQGVMLSRRESKCSVRNHLQQRYLVVAAQICS